MFFKIMAAHLHRPVKLLGWCCYLDGLRRLSRLADNVVLPLL
jgi:hypothetical protein